ncbi:MAG: type I restriction enzyme HsdR N-terminal domain-containing protein [Ginsengibacter sp.]
MIKIDFPDERPKLRQTKKIKEIFDMVRKKWLVLTPEEWVRQNILLFILVKMNYPASLIAIEKEIKLGELKKRCDIVVYSNNAEPWMIIECKEMNVSLAQKTMEQILRYHITLPAKYLVITNGSFCYGFEKNDNEFLEIDWFPKYPPQ